MVDSIFKGRKKIDFFSLLLWLGELIFVLIFTDQKGSHSFLSHTFDRVKGLS